MKTHLRIVFLCALLFAVAGCGSQNSANITAQSAAKITRGMTGAQVKAILGELGKVISDKSNIGGNTQLAFDYWSYQGANKVEVVLLNDAVSAVKVDDVQTVGP